MKTLLAMFCMVAISGCGMNAEEIASGVEDCKKHGLEPVQMINLWSYETVRIDCRIPKQKDNLEKDNE